MANINLTIGGSVLDLHWYASNPDCMALNISRDLPAIPEGTGRPIPIARDWVTFHGSPDELRSLGLRIIAALPPVSEPALCPSCGLPMSCTAGPGAGETGLVCQTPGCDFRDIEGIEV